MKRAGSAHLVPRDVVRALAALAWRIASEAGVLATALEEHGRAARARKGKRRK